MRGPAKKAIVIGTDGASMELWKRMVEWGRAPNIGKLIERGVHRPMVGTLPTLTPCGWNSLFTGSWPGSHGIWWWGSHIPGEPRHRHRWTMASSASRAEQIWHTAERAGKRPVLIKMEITWPARMKKGIEVEGAGPGISNYSQIAGYHLFVSGKWRPRPVGGSTDPEATDPSRGGRDAPFDRVGLEPAAGWTNLPDSTRPPLQVLITLQPLRRGREILNRGQKGVSKNYWGLIYASGDSGYDRVNVCRSKNFSDGLADLRVGEWSPWALETFEIDGRPVEGYVGCKLVTLTPNADTFELFYPQIWPRLGYTNPPEIAEEISAKIGNFLYNPGRDALGYVDDRTYIELLNFHHSRLAEIAEMITRNHEWDLLMIQTHATDYSDHVFMGQADPVSGAPADVIERCLNGLKDTYESVDRMIGRLMALADEDTLVAVVSDHGATPNVNASVDVPSVLERAGLLVYKDISLDHDAARTGPLGPGEVPDLVSWDVMKQNKREVDLSRSKAIPEGSIDIHIPLKGRDPYGHIDPSDYKKVQREIIEALLDHKDAKTGERPFSLALSKNEAEIINLWGPECGDVVYALRPEYDGVHGRHLPTSSLGIGSQHSTFVLAGPGVKKRVDLQRPVRVVDVAPTLCHLLGWCMPRDVEGGVLYEALEQPDWYLTDG